MGQWVKSLKSVYKVNISELDNEKAIEFAKASIGKSDEDNNLYDRYGYDFNQRVDVVRRGKLGEQAFAVYLKEVYNYDMEVDYKIYPGIHAVDSNDVFINGLNIDVKTSKDNQNRGIHKCVNYFNFPVPRTQTIKHITVVQILDYKEENIYIVTWIQKYLYEKKATYGTFPGGNGKKIPFYKCSLREGFKMNEFDTILDPDSFFSEMVLHFASKTA